MKAFEFGIELGTGFLIPAAVFSLGAAIAVLVLDEVMATRRRRRDGKQ